MTSKWLLARQTWRRTIRPAAPYFLRLFLDRQDRRRSLALSPDTAAPLRRQDRAVAKLDRFCDPRRLAGPLTFPLSPTARSHQHANREENFAQLCRQPGHFRRRDIRPDRD